MLLMAVFYLAKVQGFCTFKKVFFIFFDSFLE
nr:MAG TPA: hypothetical protein [Caudoviricetes sp.]